MITVSNNTVINSIEALNALLTIKVPAKTALTLTKLKRDTDTIVKDFESVRTKIVTDHAVKDEEGNPVPGAREGTVQIANVDEFNKEFADLLNAENELATDKIPFGVIANGEIEARHLLALDWLLTDAE